MRKRSAIPKMPNHRKIKGWLCESLTVLYLLLCGYTPLKRNVQTKIGEIDILAIKKKTLVLVEVKYRKTRQGALFAIHPEQRERLTKQLASMAGQYSCDEYRVDAALFNLSFPPFRYMKAAWE